MAVPITVLRELTAGPAIGFGAHWEQMAVARSLVAGRGFSDPFGFPTGPTAVLAPLHPLLMAAVIRIFGDSPVSTAPMLLLEAAFHVACLVLLIRISSLAFSSWTPGLVAAIGVMLYAIPSPQWENGMAAFAAELFFLCLLRRGSGVTGVVSGLGWLVSPSLILLSLPSAFAFRGARYATRVAIAALLITAPWLIRNALALQSPVFVRDSFGLELFMSNNDKAGPRQQDVRERYRLFHPNENAAEAKELARLGEPSYFGQLQTEAVSWISSHPRQFLSLTAARVRLWWAGSYVVTALGVTGLLGIWMLRREPVGKAAAAALFFFPLPYYVIQFDPRYAYPVTWLLALFAGYSIWRISQLGRDFMQRRRGLTTLGAHAGPE